MSTSDLVFATSAKSSEANAPQTLPSTPYRRQKHRSSIFIFGDVSENWSSPKTTSLSKRSVECQRQGDNPLCQYEVAGGAGGGAAWGFADVLFAYWSGRRGRGKSGSVKSAPVFFPCDQHPGGPSVGLPLAQVASKGRSHQFRVQETKGRIRESEIRNCSLRSSLTWTVTKSSTS